MELALDLTREPEFIGRLLIAFDGRTTDQVVGFNSRVIVVVVPAQIRHSSKTELLENLGSASYRKNGAQAVRLSVCHDGANSQHGAVYGPNRG